MQAKNLKHQRTNPGRLELLSDEKGIYGFGWLGREMPLIVSYRNDPVGPSIFTNVRFGELPPYADPYDLASCGEKCVWERRLTDLMERQGYGEISSEYEASEAGCLPEFRANAQCAVEEVNSLISQALDACLNREDFALAKDFWPYHTGVYYSLGEDGPAVRHLIDIFPVAAYMAFGWWNEQQRQYFAACVCELFEELREHCECAEILERYEKTRKMARQGTTAEALAPVLNLSPCFIKVRPPNCYRVFLYLKRAGRDPDPEELLREMPACDPEQGIWVQERLAELDRRYEEWRAKQERRSRKTKKKKSQQNTSGSGPGRKPEPRPSEDDSTG